MDQQCYVCAGEAVAAVVGAFAWETGSDLEIEMPIIYFCESHREAAPQKALDRMVQITSPGQLDFSGWVHASTETQAKAIRDQFVASLRETLDVGDAELLPGRLT